MNIFKKILNKFKREKKKEEACWYNNFHEQKRSRWSEPIEGEAFGSVYQMDFALSQQIAYRQS